MSLRSHAPIDTIVFRYIWSHIEPATAILCACLVTYRPLFANLHLRLPSILSRGKLGSTTRTSWSDSKTGTTSNSSSNGVATGNELEGQTLSDHHPLGYLQIHQSGVGKDRLKSELPAKRQDSEGTIESDITARPADREMSWHC